MAETVRTSRAIGSTLPLAVGAIVAIALGAFAASGPLVGLAVAAVAFALTGLARYLGPAALRPHSFLIALAALAYLSLEVPVSLVTELLVGFAALGLLLWMCEESVPLGSPLSRAGDVLGLPALGFGVALASSLLVPPGEVYLGVASVLLVLSLLAVLWVLSHPESFSRHASTSS